MSSTPPPTPEATRPRPNLLLICADHWRWDWLGANGHPLVQTPQLDKLAYGGVSFQRAFSECPVCVPARRILMTGLNPYGIHMRQNRDFQPFPEGPKLAELLTRAGYQTFAAGKLHVHPQRNRIGFEDVQLNEEGRLQSGSALDDYERWLRDHGYPHRAYTHGLGNNQYGLRLSPLPEEATTTHWTAQRAMEFVERRDPTRPFFLYVSFDKPHPPITPPASYYELYREATFPPPVYGDWVDRKPTPHLQHMRTQNLFPDWQRHPHQTQQSLRGMAAMMTHIDSQIGTLLGHLREHKVFDDTWIVFTSDHGDQMFDHGHFAKGDFFHGSPRVPFIVRPAVSEAHRRPWPRLGQADTTTPVGLSDLLPTLLDAAGVPAPSGLAGQSLLPLLAGAPRTAFRPLSFGNITSHYGVTDGRYRYQWEAETGQDYLFDQDADPRDEHDLTDQPEAQAVRAHLRAALRQWMADHGDPLADQIGTPAKGPAPAPTFYGYNGWNNRGRH